MERDDVARAAARDVARMLDRRGLRAVVELAARVAVDLGRSPVPSHRNGNGRPGAAASRPPTT